jgi:hypothetical protein
MQVKQKLKRKVSLKRKKELLDNYHSSSESNSDDEAKPNQKDNSSAEEDELSLEENHSERKEDKPIKKSKMSMVINNILNQKCNDNRPVLSQKRRIEIEIDDKKLEERAKKQITLDKKVFNNIGRVIPTNDTLPYEKQLRKISTRGGRNPLTQWCNYSMRYDKPKKQLQSKIIPMVMSFLISEFIQRNIFKGFKRG